MDSLDYKKYHEARMSNNSGTSAVEIESVLTTVSIGIFFRLFLKFYAQPSSKYLTFILDFTLIALPVTLQVTVASNRPYLIPMNMYLILFAIIIKNIEPSSVKQILLTKLSQRKSYITNYRASTNLVSCLCILAVDFTLFPGRYAKTETFGFGLMDLGVGYFICSNGIVTKNLMSSFELIKILKSSSILILLGFIRLISVKSADYHEHSSEYGVHWNFFFTLGFSRIVSYLLLLASPTRKPFFLAVLSGLLHQILLYNGFQDWVFSDIERSSFWTANKEGLTSLLGYVSLFFSSVVIGQIINNEKVTYQKLFFYLLVLSSGLWGLTWLCSSTIGVSRRLSNIGYNIWIISSTVTVILQFVIIDIVLSSIDKSRKDKLPDNKQIPLLMESINANGLFFFLFSNLMTGLINMSFQTLLLDSLTSLFLIILYMIIICGVPFVLYQKKLILKYW